jgi:hypothetical protein
MCGQSGGCMSLGEGMPINTFTEQKINTHSSATETKLVAANDFRPIILWTNYFLEAQGYGNQYTFLYQDNQSALLLENNGCKSSSISTVDYISSPTASTTMNSLLSIVPWKRWLAISSSNPCKANSSINFDASS